MKSVTKTIFLISSTYLMMSGETQAIKTLNLQTSDTDTRQNNTFKSKPIVDDQTSKVALSKDMTSEVTSTDEEESDTDHASSGSESSSFRNSKDSGSSEDSDELVGNTRIKVVKPNTFHESMVNKTSTVLSFATEAEALEYIRKFELALSGDQNYQYIFHEMRERNRLK